MSDIRKLLKEATMGSHEEAEKSSFMIDMLKGRLTKKQYVLFLVQLRYIYKALEEESEKLRDYELHASVYFPSELYRFQNISADLNYLDPKWSSYEILKSTKKYAERIHEVGIRKSARFLSHTYVRYMGDVSGGQMIRYKLRKAYQLPENGDGLKFYDFENINNIKNFKSLYFSRLNEVVQNEEAIKEILDEARLAFKMNINLFNELSKVVC
ncbi:unnamed protein product [Dimorphilus gyrociliatus]|uniref:Heme oxygenase n=1 Tax=Dimorphilus gyrociliatus TaxID=2664684 RepID=A0A7I8VEW9_9ANNE|nr:unnamed protein product [Dimorphilus gyrociliatus]